MFWSNIMPHLCSPTYLILHAVLMTVNEMDSLSFHSDHSKASHYTSVCMYCIMNPFQLLLARVSFFCDSYSHFLLISFFWKVLQRLQEEQFRSRKFLHPSSYHRVLEECQKRMVADHMSLLHSECRTMVRKEQRQGKLW